MFGPRLTRVFASRWSALWWAGGIVLLAWQIASSDELTQADSVTAAAPAADPWALDKR